ncbi:MAG: hypothetical protein JSU63_12335 [Phycisphaerales bacterium]|nr:MAG: hypothetical protein JSU63_12335 [Phycisphaerales bacterium]
MDKPANHRTPWGFPQRPEGPQRAFPRGQATRLVSKGSVCVLIPAALYEQLLRLTESTGFVNVTDYVVQVLRDEVDRNETEWGTTGYTLREVELIRKLLRDLECTD